jgi:hypothetical protein
MAVAALPCWHSCQGQPFLLMSRAVVYSTFTYCWSRLLRGTNSCVAVSARLWLPTLLRMNAWTDMIIRPVCQI